MRLNELCVATSALPQEERRNFNCTTWCVQEMYWYQLGKLTTKDLRKFGVGLGVEKPERQAGSILWRYRAFDFHRYFQLNEYERKKVILDILHEEIMAIADEHEIDKEKLVNAYNRCIDKNIEHKWLFKGKYFRSPCRTYYGSVECYLGAGSAKCIWCCFRQEKKNELRRVKFFEVEAFLGYLIYYCKCGWAGGDFFLRSHKRYATAGYRDRTWTLSANSVETS